MTDGKPMSIRATARKLGISHPTLLKAIEQGRIREAVLRDERGRVIGLDADRAAQEWLQNRSRPTAAERGAAQPTGAPTADLAAVTGRLTEIVAADLERLRGSLVELIPGMVKGAGDGLRAFGHEPTAARLVAALSLEADDGFEVICGLHELVEESPVGAARRKAARQLGRDAATRWHKRSTEEVTDGDEK